MMTSQNKISLRVRLSRKDILQAMRLYRVRNSVDTNGHILLGIALILLGVFLLAVHLLTLAEGIPDKIGLFSFVYIVVAFAAGLISIFDLVPIAISWLAHRRYVQEVPEPYEFTFDEKNVNFHGPHINTTYDWNFYQGAVEGKTLFLLVYRNRSYITIPKIAFQTEEELDTFRTILKNNLASFKQKLSI